MKEQDIQDVVAGILEALRSSGTPEGLAGQPAFPMRSQSENPNTPLLNHQDLPVAPEPSRTEKEHLKPHKSDVSHEFIRNTTARIAGGKVGTRPTTSAYLHFLADHARSKETVFKEVSDEWLEKHGLWSITTLAEDKDTYLTRPDLGRAIAPEQMQHIQKHIRERIPAPPQVQIVLSDGLSTDALLGNYEDILPPLLHGLNKAGISVGEPFFLRHGRVKAEDRIGEAIGCDVVLLLIGERPGLGQSESMSCYAVYRPDAATIESDRTVISNIHRTGTPPVEAAAVMVELVQDMLRFRASGLKLNRARLGLQ